MLGFGHILNADYKVGIRNKASGQALAEHPLIVSELGINPVRRSRGAPSRAKVVSDLKPLPKLSGEELKAIVDAIVSGYDYERLGSCSGVQMGPDTGQRIQSTARISVALSPIWLPGRSARERRESY